MAELSPLAKTLLFELVCHHQLNYDDMPEEYRNEYEEWKDINCKRNG